MRESGITEHRPDHRSSVVKTLRKVIRPGTQAQPCDGNSWAWRKGVGGGNGLHTEVTEKRSPTESVPDGPPRPAFRPALGRTDASGKTSRVRLQSGSSFHSRLSSRRAQRGAAVMCTVSLLRAHCFSAVCGKSPPLASVAPLPPCKRPFPPPFLRPSSAPPPPPCPPPFNALDASPG